MIERLSMEADYSSVEAAIHLNRYLTAKPYCKDKTVLDISCGEGYGSKLLKTWGAKKVIGLDISEEAINNATKNFKEQDLEYMVHDAMNLDCFENEIFDMVVSFETIEHLTDPLSFLKELKRVSKKNAKLIISCPNDYLYYPTKDESNPFHIKKYNYIEFKNMIEEVFDKNAVKYMIGTRAEGYMNTYIDNTTDISNQWEMIYKTKNITSLKVNQDIIIDEKNCCYYIAYININNIEENAVVFPNTLQRWIPNIINPDGIRERSLELEKKYLIENIHNKLEEIINLKSENEKEKVALKEDNKKEIDIIKESYKKEITVLKEENEKEIKILKEDNKKEIEKANKQIDTLKSKLNIKDNDIKSLNIYINSLKEELSSKEKDYNEKIDYYDKKIHDIINSKTYRLSLIPYRAFNTIFFWRKK